MRQCVYLFVATLTFAVHAVCADRVIPQSNSSHKDDKEKHCNHF